MSYDFCDELVFRAGLGLEAEDRVIIGAGKVRGEHGGLLRIPNERYYQFAVWRSVLSKWPSVMEQGSYDLIVDNRSNPPVAIIEMKKWLSSDGEVEIAGIKRDVDKLKKCEAQQRGLMIFSVNPTDENFSYFENRVFGGKPDKPRSVYSFPTINRDGKAVEFWVALWLVR